MELFENSFTLEYSPLVKNAQSCSGSILLQIYICQACAVFQALPSLLEKLDIH